MSTEVTPRNRPVVDADRQRAVEDLIALLESWTDVTDDEAREQAETFENLSRGIDESRRPYRTLFDGDRP
ncbi:MAG: hypothetical protein AB7U20_21555 [Planctomycetaceae bacterium]